MQPSRTGRPRIVAAVAILSLALIAASNETANAQACFTVVPEIVEVQPDPAAPGSFVTIVGAWFQPPDCLLDVLIGGESSPIIIWLNYHTIVAQVPLSLGDGFHDVKVVISGGGTSSPHSLEVVASTPGCNTGAVATINSVVPSIAPPNAQVTILGTMFEPPDCLNDVRIGGLSSPAYAWINHETIIANVPDGAPSGPATVEVDQNNFTSLYDEFEILDGGFACLAALPQIISVTPPTAPPGAVVAISGQLFQPPPCLKSVSFGGTTSLAHAWLNGSTILASVPPIPPGSAPVRVHINVGGTSQPFPFVVSGPGGWCPGDATNDLIVGIDDIVAVILAWGSDDPLADVDFDGLVGIDDVVTIILNWGASCPPCTGAAATIAGIDPPGISAGVPVTITGTDFDPASCLDAVTFDGLPSQLFTRIDDQTILAEVPAIEDGSITPSVDVIVEQSGGPSASFTVDVPICLTVMPNIHDAAPLTAAPGDDVTLYGGASFQGPPCLYAVTFNGVPSPAFSYDQATGSITATIPPVNPGPVYIMVHCHVGGTSEPYYYFVTPPIP